MAAVVAVRSAVDRYVGMTSGTLRTHRIPSPCNSTRTRVGRRRVVVCASLGSATRRGQAGLGHFITLTGQDTYTMIRLSALESISPETTVANE